VILTDYIIEKHLTKDLEEPKHTSINDFLERQLNKIDSEVIQKIDGHSSEVDKINNDTDKNTLDVIDSIVGKTESGDIFSHPIFSFMNPSEKLRNDLQGLSLSDKYLIKKLNAIEIGDTSYSIFDVILLKSLIEAIEYEDKTFLQAVDKEVKKVYDGDEMLKASKGLSNLLKQKDIIGQLRGLDIYFQNKTKSNKNDKLVIDNLIKEIGKYL
jgi:hypothetical protein